MPEEQVHQHGSRFRPQRVIQQAQDDVISMVRTGTTLPVLIGKRNTPAK